MNDIGAPTVANLWQRWQAWLACHAPDLAEELREPAAADDVAAAEEGLGLTFPEDFKASLAVHDGAGEISGVAGNWDLMELELVIKECRAMREMVADGTFGSAAADPHPAIKDDWWNPQWLPIVSSGSGHFLCLDLDPGDQGRPGQVVLFLHDDARRFVLAGSFREWLQRIVEGLEAGLYTWSEDDEEFADGAEAFLPSCAEGRDLYRKTVVPKAEDTRAAESPAPRSPVPAELVCEVRGVRLGPDWDEQVAEQLRVGLHRDKWDSGPADWLIRAWDALPPAGRERLSDAVHRALLHAEPAVRLGALSTLDMCSKMGQPDKLLKAASEHFELFRGLRKRNDPPDRDRGRTLVRLTAALVEGDEGRAFRRAMAFDPVYGAGVLAAQARRDPEWLLDHLWELLDPALDPHGHRLDVLVFNFRSSAGRLRRLLDELSDRDRWPAERCAKVLRKHVRDEDLLRQMLALLEPPDP